MVSCRFPRRTPQSGAGEVAGLAQVEWQRRQSIDAVSAVPQADSSNGTLTAPAVGRRQVSPAAPRGLSQRTMCECGVRPGPARTIAKPQTRQARGSRRAGRLERPHPLCAQAARPFGSAAEPFAPACTVCSPSNSPVVAETAAIVASCCLAGIALGGLAGHTRDTRGAPGRPNRLLSGYPRLLVELVDHVPVARQREPGIVAELAGDVETLRPSWRSSEAKE